jgi:hypothetical protein
MIPATADLSAAANAYDERTITIDGFASASGVSATVEFRQKQDDSATLYLALEDGDGLTLSSDGENLIIAWEITETQMDALRASLGSRSDAYYSLKVTPANGKTRQYLYGKFTVLRTATQ